MKKKGLAKLHRQLAKTISFAHHYGSTKGDLLRARNRPAAHHVPVGSWVLITEGPHAGKRGVVMKHVAGGYEVKLEIPCYDNRSLVSLDLQSSSLTACLSAFTGGRGALVSRVHVNWWRLEPLTELEVLAGVGAPVPLATCHGFNR